MRSFQTARLRRASSLLGALAILFCAAAPIVLAQTQPTQSSPPAGSGTVEICADALAQNQPTQSRVPARGGAVVICADKPKLVQGDVAIFDGHVDLKYQDQWLRADHVEYNEVTYEVTAHGHVILDHDNQHIEADDAEFNVDTGHGIFHHVHGTVRAIARPNAQVLITQNPLTFDAVEVDRIDDLTYTFKKAQLTVCDPAKPTWQFFAATGTIHLNEKVVMVNANFRLLKIPLIWFPYASAPEGEHIRQSGFLIPVAGETSLKGLVLGDAYYWAPTRWFDATLGGEYLSRRGWLENEEVRATPWQGVSLVASFFAVQDRGLPSPTGPVKQGGNETKVLFSALLAHGWRAVADVDLLSSLTFRLAFSPTFGEATSAEANSTFFLSNNFHGFSLNFQALDNKDFLNATPQTAVTIRSTPGVDFGSVDQSPFKNLPIYFGFDASADGMFRSDPLITTPTIVQRTEFAPRVTVPLHWGRWLGLTSSFTFRATRYGAELQNGAVVDNSVLRTTGELTLDLRLPTLERVYMFHGTKWKHSIDPDVVYRYVTGVNNFSNIIRFDDDDTLTDTNEIEYGITNRLFRRAADGSAQEFITWRVVQKYFFAPNFGGAVVAGQPTVIAPLDSISPFFVVTGPISYSPLVSDFTISPGGAYDGELRLEYDTHNHRFTSAGTLLKLHPRDNFTLTLAHFDINADPGIQLRSNQVRALVGYGDQSRKGWNFTGGLAYDIQQRVLENQIIQAGYNGSCCGIQFEYVHQDLGVVRPENQYKVAFVIANIGSFGNVKKQVKIF
jgi:LPS-assembly protein